MVELAIMDAGDRTGETISRLVSEQPGIEALLGEILVELKRR